MTTRKTPARKRAPAKGKTAKRGTTKSKAPTITRAQTTAKVGRLPADVSERDVELLAGLLCTNEEIGFELGVSADTIERHFAGALKKGKARGDTSLRRAQMASALGEPTRGIKPNVVAQIWLGKQRLNQRDVARVENTGPDGAALPPTGIKITFVKPTPDANVE